MLKKTQEFKISSLSKEEKSNIGPVYKTDLHLPKGEYAYFIKKSGKLFCVATSQMAAYYTPSEMVELDDLDLAVMDGLKFLSQQFHSRLRSSLSRELTYTLLSK